MLQLKLLADGFRDAILIPVSLGAALIGVLRGGAEAEREFQAVIDLGRRSERWINLFGHHRTGRGSHPAQSMDTLISSLEVVLREQVQKGAEASEARKAVKKALEEMQQDGDD